MNRCDYLDPALAWTGVKDTGRGMHAVAARLRALTRPKSFHLRTTSADDEGRNRRYQLPETSARLMIS